MLYKILGKLLSSKNRSGPGLSKEMVTAYNVSRGKPNTAHICHAPFSNMYFNVHGDCAPCWLTFIEPDSYPQKSIREIWFGARYQSLRKKLLEYNLTDKCNVCLKNLQAENYTSVLARAYDVCEPADYPSMMELELNNTCNLECVMCIGELSSSIRRNREQLPPIRSPYDESFIKQLDEFIPHLKELRFNGGEPFMIGIVYKIFEKVERLNPSLKIVVATNGTVLNTKIKDWLNRLNIHINLSIDSLTPNIYETIRVNARFENVMEHFHFYHQYCKENKRTLCIMVNPMRNNWHEMPEFIRFANEYNINVWFNTIHRPAEWSIWAMPADELEKVYTSLSSVVFTKKEQNTSLASYNIGLYKNLVNAQIKHWWREAQERALENNLSHKISINEVDAEKALLQKIKKHIYMNFDEGEEQKKYRLQIFTTKLKAVEMTIKKEYPDVPFFSNILPTPTAILYDSVAQGDIGMMSIYFKKQFVRPDIL